MRKEGRNKQEIILSNGSEAGSKVYVSVDCYRCGERLIVDEESITEEQFFALNRLSFVCPFCHHSFTNEVIKGIHDDDGNTWTPSYKEYLNSPVWKALREAALERSDRRCQVCNSDLLLNVHHRKYPEIRGFEDKNDLTVLCRRCHDLFHNSTTVKTPNPFKRRSK